MNLKGLFCDGCGKELFGYGQAEVVFDEETSAFVSLGMIGWCNRMDCSQNEVQKITVTPEETRIVIMPAVMNELNNMIREKVTVRVLGTDDFKIYGYLERAQKDEEGCDLYRVCFMNLMLDFRVADVARINGRAITLKNECDVLDMKVYK